ncbi:signal transduction histidine kinase [Kineosphaera limosa]|nr:histidine kinase [Kineosphaera limosa]NYE01681.1 signal transduction histidine kinase [Kineosphaera limosa]
MPPAPPRREISARALFWWQVLLGVGIGAGLVVILLALLAVSASIGWSVVAWPPVILAWVGLGIAGLWALERRKPVPLPAPGPAWSAHVRELRSSRLEIVNAFEIERRRIERDLHDGAQQHLVASSLQIGEAVLLLSQAEQGQKGQEGDCSEPGDRRAVALGLLERAQDATDAALAALRATVAGIHPAVLSDLGLEVAVRDLTDRSPVTVDVRVPHPLPPLPEPVAAAAYFLVAEALTNVAKHTPDSRATVLLACDDDLRVSIVDNGLGGAQVRPGHGLAGMTERLAAFGGALQVSSPLGGPTSLSARIPLLLDDGEVGIGELAQERGVDRTPGGQAR